MNSFFRKLSLRNKLMMLGILPLLFITYLTSTIYSEKSKHIQILENYKKDILQNEEITNLINELQVEEKLSYDFLTRRVTRETVENQQQKTDSILHLLKMLEFGAIRGFEKYTGLLLLNRERSDIINKKAVPDAITHYFSKTIFRLNTLNSLPEGSLTDLNAIYSDLQVQKILTEQVTYLGIIKHNIYNLLITRRYIPETLFGTNGAYEALVSYDVELREKATLPTLQQYELQKKNLASSSTYRLLNVAFGKFSLDSSLTPEQWWKISSKTQDGLLAFRKKIWQKANNHLEKVINTSISRKNTSLLLLVVFASVIFFFTAFMVKIISNMIDELKEGARMIAKGKTGVRFNIDSKDAIGSLASSILDIDDNNRKIVKAASEIGNGNFNVNVPPRSNEDELAKVLLHMRNNLGQYTQSLRESQHQFKQLNDLIPQIVWTSDIAGEPLYLNQKWYDLADTKTMWEIVHPDDQRVLKETWQQCAKQKLLYSIEVRMKNTFTGEYRWYLVRSVPVLNEEGTITKWFGTSTDIHDQKTMNEKLEKLVAQRTEELQRSNEDLMRFAHVASHDMKEPLRKIRLYVERLIGEESENTNERSKSYAEKITASAERLTQLIDGVLRFSSIDDTSHSKQKFSMAALVEENIVDLELIIAQKNAKIEYADLPELIGDRILISQLIYNLLANSLKFSSDERTPVIKITGSSIFDPGVIKRIPAGNYVRIIVEDNGIGFDENFSERIFEVFARIHDRNKYDGTGLGLALCKKIVERHHGYIYARANSNEGARFVILFPLHMLADSSFIPAKALPLPQQA